MTRPFTNVHVLDFTQVLAGPYGSYQLALLGADVIKVERREGEDMRRTPLSREWADRGMAPSWLAINGNKRSLTLDLQKPAAIDIVNRLVARADVVITAGGVTLLEALNLGRPCVTFAIAENQRANCAAVGRVGAAVVTDATGAAESACALIDDADRRAYLSTNGAALVDGQGAGRVADVIVTMTTAPTPARLAGDAAEAVAL